MKRRKIIIWSFILVAALGLNSFATQETTEQIKALSKDKVTDLAITLQTEKEIADKNAIEKEDGSHHKNLPIKLNQKVTLDQCIQSYLLTLPKNLSDKYRMQDNYLEWTVDRDANTRDYVKGVATAVVLGSVVTSFLTTKIRTSVRFTVRSPGWGGKNGVTPIPGTLGITIEKHFNTPDVEFYITATEGEGKNPGALWLNWKVYKNRTGKKKIATLERTDLTFGDIYGN